LSLQRHGMSSTESDIAWIEELIRNERGIQGNGGPTPEISKG
jgi:hypothetical protein